MGHHHARHAAPGAPRFGRAALAVVVPLAVATLAALAWLWPTGAAVTEEGASLDQVEAVVTAVDPAPCPAPTDAPEAAPGGDPTAAPTDEPGADEEPRCGTAVVELTSGSAAGTSVETTLSDAPGAPTVAEGDEVLVVRASNPDGETWTIVDHQRGTELAVVVVAFVLAVVAFGRWRGVSALAGLAVTFALLLTFVVPAILAGEPPVLVAIVASSAIALTVLYLTHGLSLTTTVAVLGTLASLTLTGLLSALAVGALQLTGVSDDITTFIGTQFRVNAEGLLLAGIVIGSLGVLDDVTVTQAATVEEIARANPGYSARQLYRAGTRVGRSHIASVINTIILAYAGSSLPLLIIIVANDDGLGDVVTDQVIAQEVVRSAVATLGLVAAVPITTALAALAVRESLARSRGGRAGR